MAKSVVSCLMSLYESRRGVSGVVCGMGVDGEGVLLVEGVHTWEA
jgi:hypothetical protein